LKILNYLRAITSYRDTEFEKAWAFYRGVDLASCGILRHGNFALVNIIVVFLVNYIH